ncbi:DNA methyltransferase [Christiangramia forsetii]|nr:DNA methyltransferase [Christiangramia forsetii]GGG24052.1 methyltransferase [Christiangramia forsetii]
MIRITQEDNMELMARAKDKEYDLAIVDPPYGINAPNMSMGTNKKRKGDGYPSVSVAQRLKKGRLNQGSGKLKNRALNTMNCEWDFEVPSQEYFKELFRISKNQIIWGGNYFDLPPTRCIVCWDKCQPWENFSQWEMAWTSFDKPAAMFRFSNTGGANQEKKIHPTQKPVKLYEYLLMKFGNPGDKIIDTHLGSGSHSIACHNLGFHLDACEKDEQYYKDSLNRLKIHQSQQRLFQI